LFHPPCRGPTVPNSGNQNYDYLTRSKIYSPKCKTKTLRDKQAASLFSLLNSANLFNIFMQNLKTESPNCKPVCSSPRAPGAGWRTGTGGGRRSSGHRARSLRPSPPRVGPPRRAVTDGHPLEDLPPSLGGMVYGNKKKQKKSSSSSSFFLTETKDNGVGQWATPFLPILRRELGWESLSSDTSTNWSRGLKTDRQRMRTASQ